jgi:hypothetical protein
VTLSDSTFSVIARMGSVTEGRSRVKGTAWELPAYNRARTYTIDRVLYFIKGENTQRELLTGFFFLEGRFELNRIEWNSMLEIAS